MKKITLLLFVTFCFTLNAQVLTEGFEGGIPVTWTQTQIDGATDWTTAANNQNSSVQPRTGTQMAYFFVGNYVNKTRLETPALDLTTLTTPVLTFYYTNATWGGDIEELRVFVKNSAGGTWSQVAEYTANAETWTEVNIVLPNPSNDYYIAFEAKANWGRGATLDDILVDELSGCLPPGSLTTTPTSTTDADLNWVAAGGESDWTYEYGLTGYTQGTGQIGGAAVNAETASITGLTSGTDYDFYVQANCGGGDGDSAYTGPFTWTQPDVGQACGTALQATVDPDCTTPLSLDFSTGVSGGASCDTFNNTVLWVKTTTTPAGGGIEISMSEAGDAAIFDACNGTEVACGPMPLALSGLAGNTEYYIAVWKDADGSTAVNDLCIVAAAPAPDCAEEPSLPVDGAIDIPVGIISLEWSAPSDMTVPPTAYNIYSGAAPDALTLVTSVDAPATTIDVTVNDFSTLIYWSIVPTNGLTEAVGPCLVWSFTTEAAPPPPGNDECADAVALTVNPDYGCGTVTNGTITSATDSGVDNCGGTEDDDVWYSFVATDTSHRVSLINISGSTTDMYHAVYDATPGCGALAAAEICNDGNVSDLTGLSIGTLYYVQVYTWTATTGQTSVFDICIGTLPTCLPPTALSSNNETETTADLGWTENGTATTWDIEWGTAGFVPGTGTTEAGVITNPFTLTGLTTDTDYEFYVLADCGGGDLSTWTGPFAFSSLPPEPVNNACINAITVDNGDSMIGSTVAATNVEALTECEGGGGSAATGCAGGTGTNNFGAGIWYVYTAGPDEAISVTTDNSIAPFFDTEIQVFSGDCNSLVCVGGDDDGGDNGALSTFCWESSATTGTTVDYYIYVDGHLANNGDFTLDVSVESTLSTTDFENQNAFTYFPNPVNNELTLKAQNNIQNVSVLNMLGQEVLRTSPNALESKLDMNTLSQGSYFIQVTINNVTEIVRIIKD